MVPMALAGLPDLDRLRELLERIREMIALGGVALALAISCVFLLAWVVSHLRRPGSTTFRARCSSASADSSQGG